MKYEIYLRILDQIIIEAPEKYSRYQDCILGSEKLNQARSRASIHLYLKVSFGILDFDDRERLVTDGSYDGGIDGYYIDTETKSLHIIQAKFRTNERNYENKQISLEELLNMDINRIMEGETDDEKGNQYNGKIKQLQREVSEIPDVARYSYKVILLANLTGVSQGKLRQLTGGYAVDVFDFERSYDSLVFPVISGTYFTASDISIPIDLSNKNAGSKISYTVATEISDCEITVLFAPTLELAKVMNKYKNTILKYNPRSYLDLEGKKVNTSIRETILNVHTNEFALYNNGITILSDETFINEKIGQKNRAQLTIKNPQIINGGQTTYTLSRIYDENKDGDLDAIFGGKEVLVKIITLLDSSSDEEKIRLIDNISNATNQQTPVINADRFANKSFHKSIQNKLFDKYGLLFERKRGEFSEGVRCHYISEENIIERNQFFRIYYSANGRINLGVQKKLFQKNKFPHFNLSDDDAFDSFYVGLHIFQKLLKTRNRNARVGKDIYAKVYIYSQWFIKFGLELNSDVVDQHMEFMESKWSEFIVHEKKHSPLGRRTYVDKLTGEKKESQFSEYRLYRSGTFANDVIEYFNAQA